MWKIKTRRKKLNKDKEKTENAEKEIEDKIIKTGRKD